MSQQDWSSVVIKSSVAKPLVGGTKTPVKLTTTTAAHTSRKVDEATEPIKMKELSQESRQSIMSARAESKRTQVELNQLCKFPVNTIREIEAGRLTPGSNQINIINRILKLQLKLS